MGDQLPLGPVTIGAREIYDAVISLTAQVGELRGELARQRDAHAVQARQVADLRDLVADQRRAVDARLGGYATRLRSVERRVWALPGSSLIVSGLAVAVAVVALL